MSAITTTKTTSSSISNGTVTRDILVWRERDSLLDLKCRLELLFGVGVHLSPPHTSPVFLSRGDGEGEVGRPANEWLKVSGSEEACYKTQQYVLATYRPEYFTVVPCGNQFANILFNGSSKLRDTIERDYQTVLQRSSQGILVQGTERSVHLAVQKLKDLIEIQEANNPETNDPEVFALSEQLRELMRKPGTVDNMTDSLKKALLERLQDKGGGGPMTTSRDPALPSPSSVQYNKRVTQFVELGYPQDKVETVVKSLGVEASDNDIMARLVSINIVRPVSTGGASSSAKPETTAVPTTMSVQREGLRPIVIDGSNIAMSHGNGTTFSCRGISIAVNYFLQRGHTEITVFVPQWRKEPSRPESPISDQEILFELARSNFVHYTPSRRVRDRKIVCYDDRFIVKLAAERGGVIVSNDHFRDLLVEKIPQWTEAIENRLLMYTFVGDSFMIPSDPLGKHGPHLDTFLRFQGGRSQTAEGTVEHPVPRDKQPCPYKEKCNFGPRCRYYHPERQENKGSDGRETSSPLQENKTSGGGMYGTKHSSPTKQFSLPIGLGGGGTSGIDSPIMQGRLVSYVPPHRQETFSPTYGFPPPPRPDAPMRQPVPQRVLPRGEMSYPPPGASDSLRQPPQPGLRPYILMNTPTTQYYSIDSPHQTAPIMGRGVPLSGPPPRPHTAPLNNPYTHPRDHSHLRDHTHPWDHTHSMLYEHAASLYPAERERIRSILYQYPQIKDMNTLMHYIGNR